MSDDDSTPEALPPVTLSELQKLVEAAKHSSAEKARLQADPAAVLHGIGRSGSQQALEFLRSLGQSNYDPAADQAKPAKDPNGGTMGEY